MEEKEKKPLFKSFQINETVYKTYLTKSYLERKPWEPDDPKKLFSFIPGTILKVLVKKGQKVKHGQTMLILEDMKMENEILAESEVKIKDIHVKVGDRIPRKTLLLEFE
ncbi:MAG: acetyl-CoA carboxylase biotin carboxyl carrier protein subunit [Salinivirgaceae bacterium]|jgi:biotin carboxyl carrier protein|nr:acetyl-CoA carboxylase biotin carboxyl carrier protein subunit [Salinivirgaceae bacterium]